MRICKLLPLAAALIVLAGMPSCRKMSDPVTDYGHLQGPVSYYSSQSYSDQFKAVWEALNSNYMLWDYELEYGVDWDEVYRKYLPVFEKFDRDYDKETNPLPDKIFEDTYWEVLSLLHDGHLILKIENLHSGEVIDFNVTQRRLLETYGESYAYSLNSVYLELDYYSNLPEDDYRHAELFNGTPSMSLPQTYECYADFFQSSLLFDVKDIRQYYPIYEEYFGEDAEHLLDFHENHLVKCILEAAAIFDNGKSPEDQIQEYYQYYFENIQPLEQAPENFVMDYQAPLDDSTYELTGYEPFFNIVGGYYMCSALINETVPYLVFNSFCLSYILNPDMADKLSTSRSMAYVLKRSQKCWRKWFDDIQRLSAEGRLKGVILDFRTNNGGNVNDAQYVSGALVNERIQAGYIRVKDGPGRFDYSPPMPQYFPALEEEHATVTCPIVILQNCWSISMSEVTTLVLSDLPNTRIVGTKSYGAFSPLLQTIDSYSYTYSGFLGRVPDSSFEIHEPLLTFMDLNMNILEGRGIEPTDGDCLELDIDTFEATGRDNQFEHALDIIFRN